MAPSGFSTALAALSLLLVLIYQTSAYVVHFAGHAGNGLLINTYFNGSGWLLLRIGWVGRIKNTRPVNHWCLLMARDQTATYPQQTRKTQNVDFNN